MARNASTSAIDSDRCAAARSASASPPIEKLTISAPPPLRRSRRDGLKCLVMAAPPSRLTGGALDRAHDAGVGATATDVVGKRLPDIRLGWILVGREKRDRLHDHAVDAVAALHRLLFNKGALHRMQPVALRKALDGHDSLRRCNFRQRMRAGAYRLAVNMDGAGAALTEPATEQRAVEIEVLAQREQQRHVGIVDGDRARPAVDVKCPTLSHINSSRLVASFARIFF